MKSPRSQWHLGTFGAMVVVLCLSGCIQPPQPSGATQRSQPATTQPSAAQQQASPDWIPAGFAEKFRRRAAKLRTSAALGLNDLAGGNGFEVAGDFPPYAYSTIKIAIVATVLRLEPRPSPDRLEQMSRAITVSDNAAAAALYNDIVAVRGGADAANSEIERTLQLGGDTTTQVPAAHEIRHWAQRQDKGALSTYGQTLWGPADQAHFVAQLLSGCVLDRRSTSRIKDLMTSVVAEQSWGLGELDSVAAFKGGWGIDEAGSHWFVRQVAEVQPGPRPGYVMALAVRLDDASPTADSPTPEQHALTALGAWVDSKLGPAPTASRCDEGTRVRAAR